MIKFTIHGEPASKANSRKIVNMPIKGTNKTRPAVIKSEKARDYERDALVQIPAAAKQMLDVPLRVTIKIYYATQRPDLDESVILDVLQAKTKGTGKNRRLVRKGVYINDRQVREKHIYHGIDKHSPRAEITIEPLEPVQQALDSAA